MVDKSVLYEKLKPIVDQRNITEEVLIEAYTRSYNLKEREAPRIDGKKYLRKPKKPDFIVRVGSTKGIRELVRPENEYKVPTVPMGALTSQNSESVPSEGGIMLDFSRMKGIEIDEELMTVTSTLDPTEL